MELSRGFRASINEYNGYIFLSIRKFYEDSVTGETRAGCPAGFNLNYHQWDKFKRYKHKLVEAANSKELLIIRLGLEKFAEARGGRIFLTRITEDESDRVFSRNTIILTSELWDGLWNVEKWIDEEFLRKNHDELYYKVNDMPQQTVTDVKEEIKNLDESTCQGIGDNLKAEDDCKKEEDEKETAMLEDCEVVECVSSVGCDKSFREEGVASVSNESLEKMTLLNQRLNVKRSSNYRQQKNDSKKRRIEIKK